MRVIQIVKRYVISFCFIEDSQKVCHQMQFVVVLSLGEYRADCVSGGVYFQFKGFVLVWVCEYWF